MNALKTTWFILAAVTMITLQCNAGTPIPENVKSLPCGPVSSPDWKYLFSSLIKGGTELNSKDLPWFDPPDQKAVKDTISRASMPDVSQVSNLYRDIDFVLPPSLLPDHECDPRNIFIGVVCRILTSKATDYYKTRKQAVICSFTPLYTKNNAELILRVAIVIYPTNDPTWDWGRNWSDYVNHDAKKAWQLLKSLLMDSKYGNNRNILLWGAITSFPKWGEDDKPYERLIEPNM